VLAILRELNAAGRTVVIITHDANVAAVARRVATMRDGRLTEGGEAAPVAGLTLAAGLRHRAAT